MKVLSEGFTFADLFSGIGGFRIACERLGGRCLGFSEIDRKAIDVYLRNFSGRGNSAGQELGSVSALGKLPFDADLIVGGVPCQSWSSIGKRLGFDDPRGRLWFDAIRIVSLNQPRAFVFENVKGLHDARNRGNLDTIVGELTKAGYAVSYRLMNSFDFGLPQNRKRIYLVGIRRDIADEMKKQYEFPNPNFGHPALSEFLDGFEKDAQEYAESQTEMRFESVSLERDASSGSFEDFFVLCDIRGGDSAVHSWDLQDTTREERMICECILKNRRKRRYGERDGNPLPAEVISSLLPDGIKCLENLQSLVKKRILKMVEDKGYDFVNSKMSSGIHGVYRIYLPNSQLFPTLTATGMNDYVSEVEVPSDGDCARRRASFLEKVYFPRRFRLVSEREAARLQGFPEDFVLDSRRAVAMHQVGNAVSVPVVFEIIRALMNS